MKPYFFISALAVSVLAVSCSNEPDFNKTVVKGNFTVADSLDDSKDYSGIGITLISRDSAESDSDTLMNVRTDKAGYFESVVLFPEKKYYHVIFSRNNKNLGNMGVILADNDTLTIEGTLPDLKETITLQSREHEAIKTLDRVDKNFQRVAAFIRGGAVPDSMIAFEIDKWSNIYWELYQKNENTLASYFAVEKSAGLLNGLDDEKMLQRIDEALPADQIVSLALQLGKPYIAETKGFQAAAKYLDSLANITANESLKELVLRDKIKMYFDSSRVREAKTLLTDYETDYATTNSQEWAKRIRYDINYLAPGVSAPDFSFVSTEGDSINKEALNGQVFILEISPLANADYLEDLDRTTVIHEIYKNYGLKIFTIPLDQSEVTIDAFFEERSKVWPVAKIGTFDVQDIIEKFNVTQVPTRLLIDKNGVVVRKYVRGEFRDVIQGLNEVFKTTNPS